MIAPPAAGANLIGLSADIIRYPTNWPAAVAGPPALPAYPGVNGIRPSDSSYVIVPAWQQKFTPEEATYLIYALTSNRAIYGQGFIVPGPPAVAQPNLVANDDLIPEIPMVIFLGQEIAGPVGPLAAYPDLNTIMTANLKYLLATASVADFCEAMFCEFGELLGYNSLGMLRNMPKV